MTCILTKRVVSSVCGTRLHPSSPLSSFFFIIQLLLKPGNVGEGWEQTIVQIKQAITICSKPQRSVLNVFSSHTKEKRGMDSAWTWDLPQPVPLHIRSPLCDLYILLTQLIIQKLFKTARSSWPVKWLAIYTWLPLYPNIYSSVTHIFTCVFSSWTTAPM